MIAVIDFCSTWIRVDLKECNRPGNIYHARRSHFGLKRDLEIAIDSVIFNHGVKVSEFRTSPAFQGSLNMALKHFKNE